MLGAPAPRLHNVAASMRRQPNLAGFRNEVCPEFFRPGHQEIERAAPHDAVRSDRK